MGLGCELMRAFQDFCMAKKHTHMFPKQLTCVGGGRGVWIPVVLVDFSFLALSDMSVTFFEQEELSAVILNFV